MSHPLVFHLAISTLRKKVDKNVPCLCLWTRLHAGSRILVLLLVALFKSMLPDFDRSASLRVPCSHDQPPRLVTTLVSEPSWPRAASALESLAVWDAVHFLQISECGHEYENQHAFFPLLPLSIRFLLNHLLYPWTPLLGQRAVLVLAGLLLTNGAFVLAAISIHRLTLLLTDNDQAFAATTAVLFCFNPASIFYSVVYTEAPFAALVFSGLAFLHARPPTISLASSAHELLGTILLALASCVRSNGITNLLFIAHRALAKVGEAEREGARSVQHFAIQCPRMMMIFFPRLV